jgi:hypothetical protein
MTSALPLGRKTGPGVDVLEMDELCSVGRHDYECRAEEEGWAVDSVVRKAASYSATADA